MATTVQVFSHIGDFTLKEWYENIIYIGYDNYNCVMTLIGLATRNRINNTGYHKPVQDT